MGRGRRDKVHLTVEQRENLEQISRNGYASAKKILHARILLMCDEGEQAQRKWTDEEIAEALQVDRHTVLRIRQRMRQKGEKPALNRQPRKTSPTPPKVDGVSEAQIMALCCSEPPEGRAEWTLRLLTQEIKQRQIITEISRETVRRPLKKTRAVKLAREDQKSCNVRITDKTAASMARKNLKPEATYCEVLECVHKYCPECSERMWNEYNNLRHVRTLKGVVQLRLKIHRCQNMSCKRYRIAYRRLARRFMGTPTS